MNAVNRFDFSIHSITLGDVLFLVSFKNIALYNSLRSILFTAAFDIFNNTSPISFGSQSFTEKKKNSLSFFNGFSGFSCFSFFGFGAEAFEEALFFFLPFFSAPAFNFF